MCCGKLISLWVGKEVTWAIKRETATQNVVGYCLGLRIVKYIDDSFLVIQNVLKLGGIKSQ